MILVFTLKNFHFKSVIKFMQPIIYYKKFYFQTIVKAQKVEFTRAIVFSNFLSLAQAPPCIFVTFFSLIRKKNHKLLRNSISPLSISERKYFQILGYILPLFNQKPYYRTLFSNLRCIPLMPGVLVSSNSVKGFPAMPLDSGGIFFDNKECLESHLHLLPTCVILL